MGRSSRERAAAPLLFLAMVSLMTLQTLAVAGHPGPVVSSVCLSLLGGDGRRCTVAGGNSISSACHNRRLSGAFYRLWVASGPARISGSTAGARKRWRWTGRHPVGGWTWLSPTWRAALLYLAVGRGTVASSTSSGK